jgi:hypothetical protein
MYDLAVRSAPTRPVTILVVDDFNGELATSGTGIYRLGARVFQLPTLLLPLLDPAVRLSRLDTELRNLERDGEISHGAVVMNHINTLIVGTGKYRSRVNVLDYGLAIFDYIGSPDQWITVEAVDTDDLDTDVIKSRMEDAITNSVLGGNSVVVNMSFSVASCNMKNDFKAIRSRYPTFERYSVAVANANAALRGPEESAADFLRRVRRTLVTPLPGDLLQMFLEDNDLPDDTRRLVYVAAAGNFGLGYATYPAAWQNVLSASASDFATPTTPVRRSTFSNYGELMMPGSWFKLTNPAGLNGPYTDAPSVVYAGTSYAAPDLTVFSALDLTLSTPRCTMPFTDDPVSSRLDDADYLRPTFRNSRLTTALLTARCGP